jgi:hypothetical protein
MDHVIDISENDQRNDSSLSFDTDMNMEDFEKLLEIEKHVDDFWEANSETETSEEEQEVSKDKYKISFKKLKYKMYENFDVDIVHKYSSALDILASYINCYIVIYSEASYYCNFKLNAFMLPCIFFSTLCSVIGSLDSNSKIIVASLNGLIAFLLAIINYLKLDASSEAHKISAYQYSKLKSYIEFSSGEILLFQDPILKNKEAINEQLELWKIKHYHLSTTQYNNEKGEKIKELYETRQALEKNIIDNIQQKIIEVKKTLKNIEENNNFILPKHIQDRYYYIRNINIFSCIKNIEGYKLILLNELRNVKNEMRFYRIKQNIEYAKKDKIIQLYQKKNQILNEFFQINNGYNLIDSMFKQELLNVNLYKKYWYLFIISRACQNINMLPSNYKDPQKMGSKDENGKYLLEKILNL